MAAVTTFQELRERYEHGERDFAGSCLDEDPDNDVSGACLDGIDLSHSFVVATFRGASLRGARFRQANVKTCDFSKADLTGADFSEAALCATTFAEARMNNAEFSGAKCHSRVLQPGEHPDW